MNEIVDKNARHIVSDEVLWIHVTGNRYYDEYKEKLSGIANLEVYQYLYDIPKYMFTSDVVICRSGAITLSELSAVGVASILIPSPNVTNDHQAYNARFFEKNNAAVMIREENLDEEFIRRVLADLVHNDEFREEMAENSRSMMLPGAAGIIVDTLLRE